MESVKDFMVYHCLKCDCVQDALIVLWLEEITVSANIGTHHGILFIELVININSLHIFPDNS